MIKIDAKNILSKENFHNEMKHLFSFPDYYGNNLDSLWDLLTEKNELNIAIYNYKYFEKNLGVYGNKIIDLFKDLEKIENYDINFIESNEIKYGSNLKDITIKTIYNKTPKIDDTVYIAEGARILGDVVLHENVNIWYNATLRADENQIEIGKSSNVQDSAVIHLSENSKVIIGENVTVGHSAIVHGAIIEDNVIIGMGATILDNAVLGKNSIIAANALVSKDKIIPEGSLVIGVPGKVIRKLTEEEIEDNIRNAKKYVNNAKANIENS